MNNQTVELIEKKFISVDGVDHGILLEFFVPQIGWEMDYKGYIIQYKGKRRLVYSDHGSLYIKDNDMVPSYSNNNGDSPTKTPRDQNWCKQRISELHQYIIGIEKALAELKNND